MDVLSDIEIARKNQMVPIEKVASKLKLEEDSLQKFGHHIAKIDIGYSHFTNSCG